ncbi:MAG: ferritin-like domain-containing protein [Chloroflexi bacterium]|nr:ferritin-like domain-containing protein [Chloroflexota bacterium]
MSQRTVELLRADMRGEHRAIIQYLFQAYMMGEGDTATALEAIAREEMRHLDWLADAITSLGGDPTMTRDDVDFCLGPLAGQLRRDVALEQEAIDQYRAHMEEIQDEGVRLTLARIIHDEVAHQGQFRHLAEAAEGEAGAPGAPAEAAVAGEPPARLLEILNQGVRHEYSVILQYLYHSFVTPDKEIMEEMQNIAINEMQHMGWLSEHAAETGGTPDMEHGDLVLTRDHREMLEADLAAEREVTRVYSRQIPEIDDEGVRAVLTRVRDHEIHHDAVFSALLEEVTGDEEAALPGAEECEPSSPADAPRRPPPPIGSLKE